MEPCIWARYLPVPRMTPSRFGFNRATSYAKDRQAGIGRRTRSGMMNGVGDLSSP